MINAVSAWQGTAPLLAHTPWAPGYWALDLHCPEVARTAIPGQFVHLRVAGPDLLLRRPISIHEVVGDRITLVVAVVGTGSQWLAERSEGEELDLIGPLGQRGLSFEPAARTVALVGGGVGIPPLHFLATRRPADGPRLVAFVGARSEERLLGLDNFAAQGCEVVISTDDGSRGFVGTNVAALAEYAAQTRIDQVLACGPTPMMRAAALWATERGIPSQVCLEARMGCGVGACLSCVVETRREGWDRYLRVCTEGPVFDGDNIVWETMSPMVKLD